MRLVRRTVTAGLVVMGVVALATALWPAVAGMVFGLLVTVAGTAGTVPALVGVRWARRELAWRRELRTLPPLDAAPYGDVVPGPMSAQLRESA